MASKPEEKPSEIDGVITADGLARLGPRYAQRRPDRIYITPEGHAKMGEQLLEKGRAARAAGKGDWVQPPSRTDLGGPR
jgi:hypothetical protein